MRIHYLQHVDFEGPAGIADWARERGHTLSGTHLYRGEDLPQLEAFDCLVVMGGPMNVYEEPLYPWLAAEKQFLGEAIGAGKGVLGICLGAQLIAAVLGARVVRNREKEIGWFPVTLTEEGKASPLFSALPSAFTPLHWHGDTFELAPGSTLMARSKGCENQAFIHDGRVVGLQFHLEATQEGLEQLIDACGDELTAGRFIQDGETMLASRRELEKLTSILSPFLDELAKIVSGGAD